jgi:hypothetical protein
VTRKVDDYYGVVIRRLAAHGDLPEGFSAPIPPSPRATAGSVPVMNVAGDGLQGPVESVP